LLHFFKSKLATIGHLMIPPFSHSVTLDAADDHLSSFFATVWRRLKVDRSALIHDRCIPFGRSDGHKVLECPAFEVNACNDTAKLFECDHA
jgi:hypothetical protein